MALATTPIAVTGLKELGETLRELESKTIKKVVRKGLRAGAKTVLPAIRMAAPKRSGDLARSFQIRSAGRMKKGQLGISIAVGKKWFVGDQFYAGFIEFGWNVGKRTSGKKSLFVDTRRRVPGRHFVERTSESKAQAAVTAIVETIRSEIDKAVGEAKKGS